MTTKRHRWDAIYDRIKDIKYPVGAEIGVHKGECSAHLLSLHPGLFLIMVDMWAEDTYKGKGDDAATAQYREQYEKKCIDNYQAAKDAVKPYNSRGMLYRFASVDFAKTIDDGFLDFCFIDASHAYEDVKADINAWIKKVKPGGWMVFHDYQLFDGVTKAVDERWPRSMQRVDWPVEDDDYTAFVRV